MREETEFTEQFGTVDISLPKTLVITTEGFDLFAKQNDIYEVLTDIQNDREIEEVFLDTHFPEELRQDLLLFLQHTDYPLAVRSSAIHEDAHYRASAGAYTTYMLPNNAADITIRLKQLIRAIQLIYSSLFQEIPRILAKNSVYRQEEDKMAAEVAGGAPPPPPGGNDDNRRRREDEELTWSDSTDKSIDEVTIEELNEE